MRVTYFHHSDLGRVETDRAELEGALASAERLGVNKIVFPFFGIEFKYQDDCAECARLREAIE